ncbi:MAG TPA: 2-oxoglutarate and iron-dependent oxygenase domain-containing protein [Pseudolabrys sp.]|nr:2-oxoglutarate and iron-dependent oxygenase domain-containing protein [Pseudolabrys sp.]
MPGIPEIDIAGFMAGDAAASRKIYAEVNAALQDVGFFTIVGHGVPSETIGALRNGAKAFFDMPSDTKQRFVNPRGSISRGYVGIGLENLGRTLGGGASIDIKEQLAFGRFEVPDTAYYKQPFAVTAFEPNIVPDVPPGFDGVVRGYYRHMEELTRTLLRIFAGALDVAPDFFVEFFDKHTSVMRIINYPDQSGIAMDAAKTRSGAHTDYGALTILLAEKALGGLQIKLRHGDWVDVDPKPDAFIVNIGDLMAMWTNDHWVSNLHRVSNPPPNPGQSTRRLSVAYFAHANYDALIRCIPTCMSDTVAARHPPVLAGEHRKAKVALSKAS